MDDSPFGIASWYPVLRGGLPPTAYVDTFDGHSAARLPARWDAMQPGERLVLRSIAPPGSRPDTRELERPLSEHGRVERFLVFPGTGGSFTLLPTVDSSALRGGIPLLPAGRARGRALWTTLGLLSPFGVARRLGRPELSIWTKGAVADDGADDGDLPALPVAGSIAVAGGVPNGNQKIVVRALDRRGVARAVLKIGRSQRSDDAVRREAEALTDLDGTLEDRAPRLLARGERHGRQWHAQEALPGRRAGDAITLEHVELLRELARASRDELPLVETAEFADAQRHLAALEPAIDPDWHAEYTTLMRALELASQGTSIPVSLAHGDFTPWNLVSHRGRLRAFDWEYFSDRSPILYDAIHFHVQTSVLVKRLPGERIFDELATLFVGPLRSLVRSEGLSAPDVLRALGLWIVHEGTTAEALERANPSPFEQASWLRHARRALCRRVAGLLGERALPDWLPGHRGEILREPKRSAA